MSPRYVTVDMFGKIGAGKTTIFNLFAGDRLLKDGGNLSYDFRTYYARCWVLPNRWSHSMVFLADPKFEFFWNQLEFKFLKKMFQATNVLLIVTDSTLEDVQNIKSAFRLFPKLKRKLVIFIIANKQDEPDALPVTEIKEILGLGDVLGISTIDADVKPKIEAFIEEGVIRYFLMLSKRGESMTLLDEEEIGLGREVKKGKLPKKKTKFSDRLQKIKSERLAGEKLEASEEKEQREKSKPEFKIRDNIELD